MAERKTPEEEAEALRAVVREAHEAMQDMRALIREARGVKAELEAACRVVFEEHIAGEIKAGLDGYAESIGKAIEDATAAVYKRFDTIADLMLGENEAARRKGDPSLTDYARKIAETRGDG